MKLTHARVTPILGLLLPCLLAGCYIKVDKSKTGEGKDVDVHLPIGGLHVHNSAPSAAEMELPTYPGATIIDEKHGNSADVDLGFGDWQMHLRVAKYQTADPQAKVVSFYRNALGHYGDVLACHDGQPSGTPTVTRDGLSCGDEHSGKGIHIDDDESGYSLRAGSKRHQHIVALKPDDGSGTRFTLLRLDLPAEHNDDGDKQE